MNQTNCSCTVNNLTTSCSPSCLPAGTDKVALEAPLVVLLCTVLAVASVFGTLGNSLVLLSVIKFERLRTMPDLFIFSLSLSDFLVTSVYQPMKAYRFVNLMNVSPNSAVVTLSTTLGLVSLIASITNMFGVTVERLISIRFPLRHTVLVTTKRVMAALLCIWIFSLANGILAAKNLVYHTYLGVYFGLILIGIISIYVYIFVAAKRVEAAVFQMQNSYNGRDIRSERKAAKTIMIILGVALVCWLPFLVVQPFIEKSTDPAKFIAVTYLLQTLSVCNSSLNPYIYCVRSKRYRAEFIKLLGLRKFVNV